MNITAKYIWDPEIVGVYILPHILKYLHSVDIVKFDPIYQEHVNKIESDSITHKRRIENLYNSGIQIGNDDPKLGYNVDWKKVYEIVSKDNDWKELFYIDDNPDYAALALDMLGDILSIENKNKLLVSASYHRYNVVKTLIQYGADPSSNNSEAIVNASRGGNLDIVNILLADDRVNPTFDHGNEDREDALSVSIRWSHPQIFKRLIEDPRVYATIDNDTLQLALLKNELEISILLLNHPNIDPSFDNNWAINKAISNGNTLLFKKLLKDNRVYSTVNLWHLFINAINDDKKDIALVLIQDYNIDPSHNNNEAITTAAKKSYDIALLLLENSRVDPGAQDNEAIIRASTHNYKMFLLFLSDPRTNSSARNNQVLINIITYNIVDALTMLLKDPMIDPSLNNNSALSTAHNFKNWDAMLLLIQDERVRSTTSIREADIEKYIKEDYKYKNIYREQMLYAILKNSLEDIIEILTKANINEITHRESIILIFDNRNQSFQEQILDSDLIDSTIYDNLILRTAARVGNYKIIKYLLKDPRVLNLIRSNRDFYKNTMKTLNLVANSIGIVI